jgi:hypothetical protein
MCLLESYQKTNMERKKLICFSSLKSLKKESDPEFDPVLLVRGTDIRIPIRTKMSQIPNTD